MPKRVRFIHDLRGKSRPKIRLIGNGVERTYGSVSGDKLIDLINVCRFSGETCDDIDKLPFPVRYELLATHENTSASFSRDDMYAEEKRMANAMKTLLPCKDTREKGKNENCNEILEEI